MDLRIYHHLPIMNLQKLAAIFLFCMMMFMPQCLRAQTMGGSRQEKFLDTEVHLLLGGSYVTENYMNCYSEISNLNNSMGVAWGVGVAVKFNLSKSIGLGTELNYLRNSGKMDLAVTTDGKPNISNVFIKNNYRSMNVPVYASFGLNLAGSVRWNVDGGLFFDFGTSGSQSATIYTASVNGVGQLVTNTTKQKTDYYDNDRAFLNSYHKFDMGLHLATGLTFMRKISVGIRGQIGFRNVADSDGIVKPNSHNLRLFATAGYVF